MDKSIGTDDECIVFGTACLYLCLGFSVVFTDWCLQPDAINYPCTGLGSSE